MSVNSSHYSTSSSPVSNTPGFVPEAKGKMIQTDEAEAPLSITMEADNTFHMSVNGKDWNSIRETAAKAGIELKDGELTTEAMQKLIEYAKVNDPGAPWLQTMKAGLNVIVEVLRQVDPAGFQAALAKFVAAGNTPPMSLFDLMLYMEGAAIDALKDQLEFGSSLVAVGNKTTVKANMASAEAYDKQADAQEAGGYDKAVAEGVGGAMSLGLTAASGTAAWKGATKSADALGAKQGMGLQQAPNALNNAAGGNAQAAELAAGRLKALADAGHPGSQAIQGMTGAAATTADTGTQVASSEAQSEASESQALASQGEAVKNTGAQTVSQSTDTARAILSAIQSALAELAASLKQASGGA